MGSGLSQWRSQCAKTLNFRRGKLRKKGCRQSADTAVLQEVGNILRSSADADSRRGVYVNRIKYRGSLLNPMNFVDVAVKVPAPAAVRGLLNVAQLKTWSHSMIAHPTIRSSRSYSRLSSN